MARGRVVLQPVENGPAVDVGQPQVERDGRGLVLARQGERPVGAVGHQALEAAVAGQIQQDLGEVRIVLDDEEDPVARLDRAAVVRDLALDHGREHHARGRGLDDLGLGLGRDGADGRRHRRLVHRLERIDDREVEGEGAPLAGRALDPDLAAEEPGDLPADREAEAGAAVLAAGAGVGLLEGLEDDAVLVRGDADAGVADGEGDHGAGGVEDLVVRVPPAGGERRLERHRPPLGELEGVGEQVLEHLLQPLAVGLERGRQRRVDVDLELETLEVGHLAEGAVHELPHLAERAPW